MRSWAAAIFYLCLAGAAFSFAHPDQVNVGAKKKAKSTAPSAATRAASNTKVEHYLETSAGTVLQQPGALVPVFAQLARAVAGQDPKFVHLMQFGDSHTAADNWTGSLRDLFKAKFGDGGSGFSVAGRPFPGYRRFDAKGGASALWHSYGGRPGAGDGFFGLGGVSVTASSPGQSIYLDAECDHLEIDYLRQPGGGTLALFDNEQRVGEIPTDGEMGAAYSAYDIAPGQHRFKLMTLDPHPVRLFGWAADRDAGVTYEALGLNGAEAAVITHWNEEMTATYLQRRKPGLIVLEYGTNEATDPSWDADSYRAMYSELIERLRRAAPTASLLAVGPGDRWRLVRGRWQIVDGIDKIVDAQQSACREHGCAFWDTRARMGGKGAMRDWVYAGLAQQDFVHFTAAGYRRLADAMYADLMQQFELFQQNRPDGGEHP